MSLIPFPHVPQLPGVPQLPRLPNLSNVNRFVQQVTTGGPLGILDAVDSVLKADSPTALLSLFLPAWGVYGPSGALIAKADSVVSFEHSKDWRVSDYPVEGGSFASFNKVEVPFDQHVVFAKGGSQAERQAFLRAIDAAVASLDLCKVLTPDATYTRANLVHYDYRRSARAGVTLLLVEVAIRQIRVAASPQFTQTASPASASPQSGGTVQGAAPSAAELRSYPDKLKALLAQAGG